MIYITGDTHGRFEKFMRKTLILTENDSVIICGDFGGVWDGSETERRVISWLAKLPCTILFVDGNHENYDMLNALPTEEWHGGKIHRIAPNVIHLMRGQVFEIEGKRFFTFGGASSHDISDGILEPDDPDFERKEAHLWWMNALYRVNHVSWWKEELPSDEEMEEGIRNLEKVGNSVDVILTHCAPTSVQDIFGESFYERDRLTDYLEKIKNTVDFKKWFFGHYHNDYVVDDKFVMMYRDVTGLDRFVR